MAQSLRTVLFERQMWRRAYAQYYLSGRCGAELTHGTILAAGVAQSLRTVLYERQVWHRPYAQYYLSDRCDAELAHSTI